MSADGYVTLSPETGLTFERERALPGGSLEIAHSVTRSSTEVPGRDAWWTPASQRR